MKSIIFLATIGMLSYAKVSYGQADGVPVQSEYDVNEKGRLNEQISSLNNVLNEYNDLAVDDERRDTLEVQVVKNMEAVLRNKDSYTSDLIALAPSVKLVKSNDNRLRIFLWKRRVGANMEYQAFIQYQPGNKYKEVNYGNLPLIKQLYTLPVPEKDRHVYLALGHRDGEGSEKTEEAILITITDNLVVKNVQTVSYVSGKSQNAFKYNTKSKILSFNYYPEEATKEDKNGRQQGGYLWKGDRFYQLKNGKMQ